MPVNEDMHIKVTPSLSYILLSCVHLYPSWFHHVQNQRNPGFTLRYGAFHLVACGFDRSESDSEAGRRFAVCRECDCFSWRPRIFQLLLWCFVAVRQGLWFIVSPANILHALLVTVPPDRLAAAF